MINFGFVYVITLSTYILAKLDFIISQFKLDHTSII